MASQTSSSLPSLGEFSLTEQQINYFEDFGFLRIRGLFVDEIETMREGYEEVFANNDALITSEDDWIHYVPEGDYEGDVRHTVGDFVDKSPKLSWLRSDPRVLGIARDLVGEDVVYHGSEGNRMNCNVGWHPDNYMSPLEIKHIKLMFYMDRLDASNGALRVVPGTCHWDESYATRMRRTLGFKNPMKFYGMNPDDVPAYVLDVEPGDLVIDNYRTIHGSFNGGPGRRLFGINFRE